MPLKATELYGKISEQMKLVPKAAFKQAVQVQEALLVEKKFVPVGDLLIQDRAIDAATNESILVQHRFTNLLQDEEIVGKWLLERALATGEQVQEANQQTRLAMRHGRTIPRSIAYLSEKGVLSGEAGANALRLVEEVLEPLHEMTRYFTRFPDPASRDVTHGRIAFQNHLASREDLFEVLLERATGNGVVRRTQLLERLRQTDRLGPDAEASVSRLIERFSP